MGGIRERVSRSKPCELCGVTDLDMRMIYQDDFGNQEVVHWCRKTNGTTGEVRIINGKKYYCKVAGKEIDTCGRFDLWTEYLSKEDWMLRQEQTNPNWRPSRKSGQLSSYRKAVPEAPMVEGVILTPSNPNELAQGQCEALSHYLLDQRYRFLLSLLVLEDKHRNSIEEEWASDAYPNLKSLLDEYPIRSMPPIDEARRGGEAFRNPKRAFIVKKMLEEFGDLRGVPMFYLRTGSYWETRPESERWDICGAEGTLFPCYDKNGCLWALRIKLDYPDLRVKEGKHPPFMGGYGVFHHYYDYTKNYCHAWYFDDGKKKTVVYSAGSNTNLVNLTAKGLPDVPSKPEGKYKTMASIWLTTIRDNSGMYIGTKNELYCGSTVGSPYSIYSRSGDDWKVVWGTEGEKKAMVANYVKRQPVIDIAGVWNFSILWEDGVINYLKEQGMKVFCLCYDADKEENESVRNAEHSFIRKLKEEGITVLVGEWSMRHQKGWDDILVMGLSESLRRI